MCICVCRYVFIPIALLISLGNRVNLICNDFICPLSSQAVPHLAEFSLVPRTPSSAFILHCLLQFLYFLKPSFLCICAQFKTKRKKEKGTEENEQKDQGFSNSIIPAVAGIWVPCSPRATRGTGAPSEAGRKGGSGIPRPGKGRLKGTPAAIIKWSASMWILTTQLLASHANAWLWQEATRWGAGRKRVQAYMILKDHYQVWDTDQWFGPQSPTTKAPSALKILSFSLHAANTAWVQTTSLLQHRPVRLHWGLPVLSPSFFSS